VSPRPLLLLGTALLLLAGSRVGAAQNISVNPASTGPLTISTAVAGLEPTSVSGVSGGTYTFSLKNNGGLRTITAQLTAPLPAGTTLSIALGSTGGGAVSAGTVQLTTSATPVVTNLPNAKVTNASSTITYSFSATSAAGVVALRTVNVTLALAP
jgi:hypothetical protein